MKDSTHDLDASLRALAAHLHSRRGALLDAWRQAVKQDPTLTTGNALPRAELNDHLPAVLAAFEQTLETSSEGAAANEDAAATHGLHRWQQGYNLREVTRELGRLNQCVVDELERYAETHADLPAAVMATARRRWAKACSVDIEESTAQYFRLLQTEAAGHVRDLEKALEDVRELEQQRGQLWQQLAHDLRGNVGVVATATQILSRHGEPAPAQEKFLKMLERNVRSLHHLLDDVTSLALLQAGHEQRHLVQVDVGTLLHELCEGLLPHAQQRQLTLKHEGPVPFLVEADPVKTRRLAQNLVLNAIKYTLEGGVTVRWGDADAGDAKRWVLCVEDTGPGFHAGPGAPLAGALESATRLPYDATRSAPAATMAAAAAGESVQMPSSLPHAPDRRPQRQGPGEGIGLSIVKRLCELLDATIELESSEATGTTFRILLPRSYAAAAPPTGKAS